MASPFKPESILYLGLLPSGLALVGVLANWRNSREKRTVCLLAMTALAFFLFSLPPFIPLGGVRIYSPSSILFKIFPTYRVLARFGVMVMLTVAVLAGFGLKYLLGRIGSSGKRGLVVLVAFLLLCFEFLNVPPFHWTDYSQIPDYYVWVKEQKGDFIVADYPIKAFDFAESQIWQTFHGKRLLNGSPEWATAKLGETLSDLEDPEVVTKLKELGVQYVICHTHDYLYGGKHLVDGHRANRFSLPPDSPEKSGLKLVKSGSGAVVLEVL